MLGLDEAWVVKKST